MKKLLERIIFGPRCKGTPVPPPKFRSQETPQPDYNRWCIYIRRSLEYPMRFNKI